MLGRPRSNGGGTHGMARRAKRPGDLSRWFQPGPNRALELVLRGNERPLVGFPLGLGKRLVAFERWDLEAMSPRCVELIPTLAIESLARGGPLTARVEALVDLDMRRSFFGADAALAGLELDSRQRALVGLAAAGRFVRLHLDRVAGGAVLGGRVLHPGPGCVLLEGSRGDFGLPVPHASAPSARALSLVRLAHVARMGLANERADGALGHVDDPVLRELATAAAEEIGRSVTPTHVPMLVRALVGQTVEVELSAPGRLVEGRLLAVGGEWFALDSVDERRVRRGVECFALDDVEVVEVRDPKPTPTDSDTGIALPELESLPAALRAAQRLWSGVVLELLAGDQGPFLAEVLEVGERGLFLERVPLHGSSTHYGQTWHDLAAVLSFAEPNRAEREALRRARRPRPG